MLGEYAKSPEPLVTHLRFFNFRKSRYCHPYSLSACFKWLGTFFIPEPIGMKNPPLTETEKELICSVLQMYPEVQEARLFGSRAKGIHHPQSDIDIAIWGDVDALQAESIAGDLDDLPLPYHFDVLPFHMIKLKNLRNHIERVGVQIFSLNKSSIKSCHS